MVLPTLPILFWLANLPLQMDILSLLSGKSKLGNDGKVLGIWTYIGQFLINKNIADYTLKVYNGC